MEHYILDKKSVLQNVLDNLDGFISYHQRTVDKHGTDDDGRTINLDFLQRLKQLRDSSI